MLPPPEEETESPGALHGIPIRYVLTPDFFRGLHTVSDVAGCNSLEELICLMARQLPHVVHHPFEGVIDDCGNKLGLLKAVARLGFSDSTHGSELHAFAVELLAQRKGYDSRRMLARAGKKSGTQFDR